MFVDDARAVCAARASLQGCVVYACASLATGSELPASAAEASMAWDTSALIRAFASRAARFSAFSCSRFAFARAVLSTKHHSKVPTVIAFGVARA